MPCSHKNVEILLKKLEQNLREAMLWSNSVPSLNALQSQLPFAVDTLSFEQWLQFIFIPKMSEIVSTQSALPESLTLLPMAEQSFGVADHHFDVIEAIRQIDLVFERL